MYDNKENNFKKKGLCISLCAALVCGLGIGGVYYKTNKSPQNDGTKLFSDSSAGRLSADADKKADSSNDKKTEENTENKTLTAGSGNVKNIKKNTKKASVKSAREKINDAKEENNKKDIVSNNENKKTNKAEKDKNKKQGKTVNTMSNDNSLKFDAEKGLVWPVGSSEKDIILKFSDSNTVYFKTLAQYKINPAVVIAAKTDEKVKAAAAGVVKSVKTDDETGTTVTVDIGSGYEVKYGQLKNLNVKTGQKIAKGEIVGHIAKPTKYYTLEGSNLYFEVTENGKSVDPLLLLK